MKIFNILQNNLTKGKAMQKQKKIAAINDISCIGKCSLTVALPLLSAAGFEVCPLPTALLSTHTGDFKGYTFMDLTSQLSPIANHWKSFGASFDAVYSGYLGSYKQLEFTKSFIDDFGKNALTLVDPVMADHGRLYAGFDMDFVKGMKALCEKADVLVPNITEACLLTDTPYLGEIQNKKDVSQLCEKLCAICGGNVIITGVSFDDEKMGAAVCFDGRTEYVFSDKLDIVYHGTGDVFASALLAALLRDFSSVDAIRVAVDFVCECIKQTIKTSGRNHYGVNFELCIKKLLEMLKII